MGQVYAQVNIDGNLFSPAGTFPTVGRLINIILFNALTISGIIALFFLVIGGFGVIMSAGGDPKKLESGQKTITGAIIGLVLVVAAYWIVQLIEYITGLPLLRASN
jgi:hypothetical protein